MKNSLQSIATGPRVLKATSLLFLMLSYIFSFAQPGVWQKKQSFATNSTTRGYGTGFSIGNKGYYGTGITPDEEFKNDFWEYDPAANTWTQKANFGGTPRGSAVGFSIGNKGYIGTGVDCPSYLCYTKDFWEYDPALNKWTRKADFPGSSTAAAVGFSIGNKGYLGTGSATDSLENNASSRQFWEYDPTTDKWTQKADFGGAGRYSAVGLSIGTKGYIGTGGYSKDFWEYDPATDKWSQKADFGGSARENAAGFTIGNKGFIGTGQPLGLGYLADFWEYDPATNAWSAKTAFPGDFRMAATGFSIGSKGYLGFGVGFGDVSDFWEYTPGIENPITVHASTTTFCSGSTYVISYTTSGTFNADNVFTAQLSDYSGSFTFPYVIGSVNSSVSGNINVQFPRAFGTNFRIRVISSSPAITGNDDGTNYTINPPPVAKTKNITVALNPQGTVTITPEQVDNGSTALCGGLTYSLSRTTFYPANIGENAVTLTVTDANNQTSPAQAIVTVVPNGCLTWYRDADGDGYGNPNISITACTPPAGYVINNTDCNDNNNMIHPITYYRDYDRDGFGDPYHPRDFCTDVPPAGYVKNNYDCYDGEGASDPGYVRIRMCQGGWTQCVYAKDTADRISQGWTVGLCSLQTCGNDETLMCHNGRQECVKTTDVAAKLAEPGGYWSVGPFCSGVPISKLGSNRAGKMDKAITENSLPTQYSLSNHPNPFVGTSVIKYELPHDSKVSIKVYDLTGRTVATLVDEYKKAGTYTVNFNATNLSSGSLFYKIIATSKVGQYQQTNQMVKIK